MEVTRTGTGVTVTVIFFFILFAAFTVITALPVSCAVITPSAFTEAIPSALDEKESLLSDAYSGKTFACRRYVSPLTMEKALPAEVM